MRVPIFFVKSRKKKMCVRFFFAGREKRAFHLIELKSGDPMHKPNLGCYSKKNIDQLPELPPAVLLTDNFRDRNEKNKQQQQQQHNVSSQQPNGLQEAVMIVINKNKMEKKNKFNKKKKKRSAKKQSLNGGWIGMVVLLNGFCRSSFLRVRMAKQTNRRFSFHFQHAFLVFLLFTLSRLFRFP